VPGIAVVVAGPEGLRAAGAAGLADIVAHRPASLGMVCPWFSMTKVVTATAAVRLAERGVLDLDAPVDRHVPALSRVRPRQWASRITTRHLLSHSAGLPNPVPVRWIHRADQPAPDPDVFLGGLLARHGRLRFEPGTRSTYSNLGPLVVAAALAATTGRPFTELVHQEILHPLGMRATAFTYTPQARPLAAVGYHPRRSPMRLLLPRWAIGEPAGRWIALRPFLVDGAATAAWSAPQRSSPASCNCTCATANWTEPASSARRRPPRCGRSPWRGAAMTWAWAGSAPPASATQTRRS